jgi:hypothetical protein
MSRSRFVRALSPRRFVRALSPRRFVRALSPRDAPAGKAIGLAAVAAVAFTLTDVVARAQAIDPARPHTLVVGVPAGARTDRVDDARTGFARTPLPARGLRIAWRIPTGAPLEHGPLVDARGTTYVVTTRGEAVAVGPEGNEIWRVQTGAVDPGPAALLSDDTLVWVDGAGEAVAVRDAGVRWRTRIGHPDALSPPAPLPLDDGGVIVATARDLALLDAGGHERARIAFPEFIVGPLLSAVGRAIAVGTSGAVWTWAPGADEPSRLGGFGSSTAGGAALAGDHTLVAVVSGRTTLAAVDLVRGTTTVRAVASGGLWLGPPAMHGEAATLALFGPTSEVAVTLDASGHELARTLLAAHSPALRGDAGPGEPPPASFSLLVDRAGTVAFATLDGGVGVASMGPGGDGAVETVSEACPRPGALSALAGATLSAVGIAPLTPGAFVVTCRSGTLVAVAGSASARH